MRLVDLKPRWIGYGGPGLTDASGAEPKRREQIGLELDCPCGACGQRLYIPFANPLDGGPQVGTIGWQRTGETFEMMTLTPSILRSKPHSCGWHGWITAGVVRSC